MSRSCMEKRRKIELFNVTPHGLIILIACSTCCSRYRGRINGNDRDHLSSPNLSIAPPGQAGSEGSHDAAEGKPLQFHKFHFNYQRSKNRDRLSGWCAESEKTHLRLC